jgi:hypothetical protein
MSQIDCKCPAADHQKKTLSPGKYNRNKKWRLTSLISRLMLYALLLLFSGTAFGQAVSANSLVKITTAADSFRTVHPIEKMYLQFDKPYYAVGDTLWFKAYLVNAADLKPADKTGICYVELADADNKVVKRIMLPVAGGLSWGNIALDGDDFAGGSYTLRAYTRWMCNFGDDYIFKKNIYIFNAPANGRAVNEKISFSKDNGLEAAHIGLHFNTLDGYPLVLKDMELDVMDGSKALHKEKVRTMVDGALDVDLALKSNIKHLGLSFTDAGTTGTSQKMFIPVIFNRPENTDVQFMPEGGYLVAGLPAHIGFKAIGEDGKAAEIEGKVYDSKQQIIASFKSTHKGMGAFDMLPQTGETYSASVTLPGGLLKTYPFPPVKSMGTVLKVREEKGADSLAITLTGTQDGDSYYLIGQSGGVVCYAAMLTLSRHAAKVKIAGAVFPTGIARFTLLSNNRQTLNERLVFINHHDNLMINMQPDKPVYGDKGKVNIQVHVTDTDGRPAAGNFSVAVTDDAQVKTDSLSNNIISNLLLTSGLKGNIEEPAYYFQPDTSGRIKQQLDNLLLTQGWAGYDWADVFGPPKVFPYADETNFIIKGSVTNVFNKPVAKADVILLSRKPSFVLNAATGKDGRFTFSNIVPVDTPAYFIQARNKNGRSFNINVKVDEFTPPAFGPAGENPMPWYVNSDSTLMNYAKNNIAHKAEQENLTGGGHMLKEVVINAKKIIKGSQNPNGPGNADIVIDEQELEKAGNKTFLQLLQEKVPGFKEGFMLLSPPPDFEKVRENRVIAAFITDDKDALKKDEGWEDEDWYYINGKPVKFIIDGISLYKIMTMTPPAITNINDYLNAHSAADIKGIEVSSSSKYASRYIPIDWAMDVSMSDVAFVEITTRSGGGPGISNTPGIYLYKPLPFSLPKQFYSPKYKVKDKETVNDYRSTIYWKPDLATDQDGNATISFYTAGTKYPTAGKSGCYTLILEGTDGNGFTGYRREKIKIDAK